MELRSFHSAGAKLFLTGNRKRKDHSFGSAGAVLYSLKDSANFITLESVNSFYAHDLRDFIAATTTQEEICTVRSLCGFSHTTMQRLEALVYSFMADSCFPWSGCRTWRYVNSKATPGSVLLFTMV
jgi:hypothetical protein